MSIDYAKIRAENIRRYGTDVNIYGPTLLEGQYRSRTHFIYELLQNAEDAGATLVKFKLTPTCLELEHNGRAFNEADVIGICGLVRGTKRDDLTKIGKFGIGFKSVYAHTSSPEIHCGDEHFIVRDYVHPDDIVEPRKSKLGTLFVFPFNRQDVLRKSSYSAISSRLRDLGIRTLLFLSNIETIEYEIAEDTSGSYSRQTTEILEEDFAKKVELLGHSRLQEETENWLIFERSVSSLAQTNNVPINVEIAFRISDNSPEESPVIEPLSRSDLIVYFPTSMPTGLGFLVQGPYQTNTARNEISDETPFNANLLNETGELLTDTLRWLRDRTWLTAEILETMPLAYIERESHYDYYLGRNRVHESLEEKYEAFLEPVYQKVKQALFTEALIPAYAGGYIAAENAKAIESKELRELLEIVCKSELIGIDDGSQWITDEITADLTPNLLRYLTTMLNVETIDAEKLIRRIDTNFMNEQSDDWVRCFYEFAPIGLRSVLRQKPIIRRVDGSHVVPFSGSHKPQAYLPTSHESRFPMVKPAVCDSDKALKFLKDMGLNEPDIVDEVLALVLPKYADSRKIDINENLKDLDVIVQALAVDSWQRRHALSSSLAKTRFLRATSANGVSSLCRPKDLYFRTPELESYFCENPDAWFISSGYEEYESELLQLGVADGIRVDCKPPNRHGHVTLKDLYGWNERGLHGFDPNWSVDGMDFALKDPSIGRSRVIWNNILIPHKHLIRGEIESCTRQTFEGSETETKLSLIGGKLRATAWLPDGSGGFVLPSTLTVDDLPDGFRRDRDLATALAMHTSYDSVIEDLRNSDEAPEQLIRSLELLKEFEEEELEFARKVILEKRAKDLETIETVNSDDYAPTLKEAFERPVVNRRRQATVPDRPNERNDDERRREAEDDIINEPEVSERIEYRLRREWEPKNPETRRFLYNEYGGECQICSNTFEKRDGQNYFEAVHIIPRTSARFLDHSRNALCLCANHSAQFHAGAIDTPDEDIIKEILSSEEGQPFGIVILLCKEPQAITFSPNHIDEFRGGLDAAEQL